MNAGRQPNQDERQEQRKVPTPDAGRNGALLSELAECNACDPNRNRSNAGVWTTVNVPTTLWKRVLAAAQAQGELHG